MTPGLSAAGPPVLTDGREMLVMIRYQVTIARLPLAEELADFNFSATPVNER